jgi:hypothetical protein
MNSMVPSPLSLEYAHTRTMPDSRAKHNLEMFYDEIGAVCFLHPGAFLARFPIIPCQDKQELKTRKPSTL